MFFTSDRIVRGHMTRQSDKPEWGPFLELAPDHVDDFMWMFEVELESGLRLHAYKHIETRKYLHLDKEGRAFAYIWPDEIRDADEPGSYREVDPSASSERSCGGGVSEMPNVSRFYGITIMMFFDESDPRGSTVTFTPNTPGWSPHLRSEPRMSRGGVAFARGTAGEEVGRYPPRGACG